MSDLVPFPSVCPQWQSGSLVAPRKPTPGGPISLDKRGYRLPPRTQPHRVRRVLGPEFTSPTRRVCIGDAFDHIAHNDELALRLPTTAIQTETIEVSDASEAPVAAASVLWFQPRPVARWTHAIGADYRRWRRWLPGGRGLLSMAVSFGYVAVADICVAKALRRMVGGGDDAVQEAVNAVTPSQTTSVVLRIAGAEGADVYLIQSGRGDGVYSAWVGRDKGGSPCCVILDFGMLELPFDQSAPPG